MLRVSKKIPDPRKNIIYGDTKYEMLNHFTYDESKKYPIRIEAIGITRPNKKYFIERQHSDYFVLEYITAGKGYVVCDDKKYTVEENDIYLIHLGTKHRYGADPSDPYEKIWVNLFSSIFTDIISAYGLSNRVVFKNTNCKELFEELLDLAIKYNFIIVNDNTYGYFTYNKKPHSLFNNEKAYQCAIEIHSMSKIYNMTGMRIGFVAGNAQIIDIFKKVKDNVDSGQYIPIQLAASEAILSCNKYY